MTTCKTTAPMPAPTARPGGKAMQVIPGDTPPEGRVSRAETACYMGVVPGLSTVAQAETAILAAFGASAGNHCG